MNALLLRLSGGGERDNQHAPAQGRNQQQGFKYLSIYVLGDQSHTKLVPGSPTNLHPAGVESC